MNSIDPFRPRWHFAPSRNWMNDPNGLVFFDGEYHLFFQQNPYGCDWGNIGWGHAVSRDLLSWTELEPALTADEFMAFSGSAVIDHGNVSGLGDGAHPPMLAFYTAHYSAKDTSAPQQRQHIAYSVDRGRTWTEYAGNPVLDYGLENFRDPKVFWHAASSAWIMVVAFATEHQFGIFRSVDLLHWKEASRFGPAGLAAGQWECPELFEVQIDEGPETRWVLKCDVDREVIGPLSGSQYFIGTFNGTVFEADAQPTVRVTDYGPDFYAAQCFTNLPEAQTRPVWIAWCSNHQLAPRYPTRGWQGCQSLPRELFLFASEEGWSLGQRPIEAWEGHLTKVQTYSDAQLSDQDVRPVDVLSASGSWDAVFTVQSEDGRAGLRIAADNGEVFVGVDTRVKRAFVDLRRAGVATADGLDRVYETQEVANPHRLVFRLIWDATTLEVFINGGRLVMTCRVFLRGEARLAFETKYGAARVADVAVRQPSSCDVR